MSQTIVRALGSAEKALAELRAAMEAKDPQIARDDRWRKILTAVEDAGGRITAEEWGDLGRKCGYDPRGLGGFYRGVNPSMQVNSDGTRSLTATGKAYLDHRGRAR